jgi:hypothetical protein
MNDPGRRNVEGGFALALVVLMLFAIAVAGVTGYQAVSTELVLSTQNRDEQKALTVARAGLQRFLGEQIGEVGDSVSYAIGDGIATVTARRVVQKDSLNHLYYLRSTGTVADPAAPANPARRSVGTYAWHRLDPIPLKGALWVSGGNVNLSYDGTLYADVNGFDHSTAGDCPGGGTAGTAGVVHGGTVFTTGTPPSRGSFVGSPDGFGYPGFSAMYNAVGVRWDILTSPSFPVDFENSMPDFTSPALADSFPVIRFDGDLTQHFTNGHGVLIVSGTFVPGFLFSWDGIILAGALGDVSNYDPEVRGMLIAGLNGSNPDVTLQSGTFYYHACNAYKADAALSYLEVVDRTFFEING